MVSLKSNIYVTFFSSQGSGIIAEEEDQEDCKRQKQWVTKGKGCHLGNSRAAADMYPVEYSKTTTVDLEYNSKAEA